MLALTIALSLFLTPSRKPGTGKMNLSSSLLSSVYFFAAALADELGEVTLVRHELAGLVVDDVRAHAVEEPESCETIIDETVVCEMR